MRERVDVLHRGRHRLVRGNHGERERERVKEREREREKNRAEMRRPNVPAVVS